MKETKEGDSIIRSGVIVYSPNNKVLGCAPTNWEDLGFDIPKGHIEMGETPLQAAVRELQEETGIKTTPDKLTNPKKINVLGSWYYIWELYLEEDILIEDLNCPSTFIDKKDGIEKPEMSSYEWIDLNEYEYYSWIEKFQFKILLILKKYFNLA